MMFNGNRLELLRCRVLTAEFGEAIDHRFGLAAPGQMLDRRAESALAQGPFRLGGKVRLGVTRHGDMGDIGQLQPIVGEQPAHRMFGKFRRVLEALTQPLLGNRADQLAVDNQARRRIRVKGVQPEYNAHETKPILYNWPLLATFIRSLAG